MSAEAAAAATAGGASSPSSSDSLANKVKEQLNFYFGDINLARDRYLRQKITQNEQGFVSIRELMSFNKLKSMTQDVSVVVEAAKLSDLLEVSEDNSAIRRKTKLPGKELPVDVCVVASGWPLNATSEEITEAAASIEGVEPQSCMLRKDKLVFNGEAFIELSDAAQARKLIERAADIKFRKTESLSNLKIEPIADWMSRYKHVERPARSQRQNEKSDGARQNNRNDSKPPSQQQPEIVPGCLLKFEGLPNTCTREIIRTAINARVSFIDYQRGEPTATVRFVTPADCEQGIESLKSNPADSPFIYSGHRILDENETKDYLGVIEARKNERFSKLAHEQAKQKNSGNRQRRQNGGNQNNNRRGEHRDKRTKTD